MASFARRRLLALSTYPATWASTRLRVEALAPYLDEFGIELVQRPLLSERAFARFYERGRAADKARTLIASTLRQTRAYKASKAAT